MRSTQLTSNHFQDDGRTRRASLRAPELRLARQTRSQRNSGPASTQQLRTHHHSQQLAQMVTLSGLCFLRKSHFTERIFTWPHEPLGGLKIYLPMVAPRVNPLPLTKYTNWHKIVPVWIQTRFVLKQKLVCPTWPDHRPFEKKLILLIKLALPQAAQLSLHFWCKAEN